MNKKKNLIFFLILLLLVNCSFDTKTGIWTGVEDEKIRISKLEEERRIETNRKKIYSSENIYFKEKILTQKIRCYCCKKKLKTFISQFKCKCKNIFIGS